MLAPKIRSPETFYRDMMTFKDRKEEKLSSIRKEQDSLIKSRSCINSKRFSSTQEKDLFFENLSRAKRTETTSKDNNVDLKNVAQRTHIKLPDCGEALSHNGTQSHLSPSSADQRQELLQRLDQRSRSYRVPTSHCRSQHRVNGCSSKPPR